MPMPLAHLQPSPRALQMLLLLIGAFTSVDALRLPAQHQIRPFVSAGVRPLSTGMRVPAPKAMQAGGGGQIDGVRVGPPPDLPSLLLNNRIVYCGLPLVPSVTELMVAELLYLNYESNDKAVYMYINSPGTSTANGQAFETEAFAIADTMNYIGPEIETICIGQAFGTAAMLLANGKKGSRACLPNASILLHQPRSRARGQASDIKIKAREVLTARNTINSMLAEKTGQTLEKVMMDSSRTKYFSPEQAMEYGIIDKVLRNQDDLPAKPSFLSAL